MQPLSKLCLFALMATQLSAAQWEKLPSMPEPAGNFVCGTSGDDLVIAGGITWKNDTKIWRNQISVFQTKVKRWKEDGTLPHPLAYAAFGQAQQNIYFAGGADGIATRKGFYVWDPKRGYKMIGILPQPLLYSANAIADGKLFIIAGGADAADLKRLTNSVYAVDLQSGGAKQLQNYPGGNVIVPTAVAHRKHVFVFTGALFDAEKNQAINLDSSFVYSIEGNTWRPIQAFPSKVRGLAGCRLDDRYILLAGGYTNDFVDDAFLYDTKTDSYVRTTSLPYRAMVSLLKSGDHIYCLGGEDKMRHRSDLMYRIPCTDLITNAAKEP